MLVDPAGNRLQTSTAIAITDNNIGDSTGQFEYLVEACDPCEADPYTYQIGHLGVGFSDPAFLRPQPRSGCAIQLYRCDPKPRQILPGGYISWIDPETNEVQQILWVDPSQPPQLKNLGSANGAKSLRGFVEKHTHHLARKRRAQPTAEAMAARRAYRARFEEVAAIRAKHYV